MINNLAEKLGFALIVAFLWFVWPPLCLLGAGLLLVVWANVRASRAAETPNRALTALAAAWGAAKQAYRRQESTVELRRVA